MSAITYRVAREEDASAILEIYSPFILETAVSFETEVPTLGEFRARMASIMQTHPWLVAEDSGRIIGYAYSNPHRARAAYQWSAESSIYLSESARGKGLARELYDRLFTLLRLQGIRMVMAGATLPNPASEKFHLRYGFQTVGVYPRVGYKFEAWHDVGWWYKEIPQQPGGPTPFRAFPELSSEELIQVLGG